jgi:hypothetical protein
LVLKVILDLKVIQASRALKVTQERKAFRDCKDPKVILVRRALKAIQEHKVFRVIQAHKATQVLKEI